MLTLSTHAGGAYGLRPDDLLGLPCLVGRQGVRRTLTLALTPDERALLHKSAGTLRQALHSL